MGRRHYIKNTCRIFPIYFKIYSGKWETEDIY